MKYLSRAQWGAKAPLGRKMARPVGTVYIHHSVTSPTNDPINDARAIERVGIQRFGIMSYSYLIHPDGTVIEGAGDTLGAHTGGYNSTSLGVCFIGNFVAVAPTEAALNASVELIKWLVSTGRVKKDPVIKPHRSVKATACPGDQLNALIPCITLNTRVSVSSPTAPVPSSPAADTTVVAFLKKLRADAVAASKVTLKQGSKGKHVQTLQMLLFAKGATQLKADGDFGPLTANAVKWFQKLAGLKVDGIVGPQTWGVLLR